MGIVDEPVEDGIGDGGVTDRVMPVFKGQLTGNDCGNTVVPLFDNFQEVASFRVRHGGEAEIIYDEDMGFGELIDDLAVAAVAPRHGHLIGEPGGAQVEAAEALPAGTVGKGAGDKGLAHTRGTRDDDILVLCDPLTGAEAQDDGLVYPPGGFIVDILDTGIELEPGIFEISPQAAVFPPAPFVIDKDPETLLEGELRAGGLFELQL